MLKHISDKEKIVPIHSYADMEKALGLYQCLKRDEFFVKLDLLEADTLEQKLDIKCKLTLRICLKFHMKIFNPLGLVLPTRMWRNLLFRCTLQIIEKAERDRIPWDEKLHSNLVADWFTYFDML